MACTNCENNTQNTAFSYSFNTKNCTNCGTSCETQLDSSCVIYTGSALTCTNIGTNVTVEEALKALDTKICSIDATDIDWSSFDYACLTGSGPQFTTAQEFVEAISEFVCTTDTDFRSYVTSNNSSVTGIANRTHAIENPALSTNSYLSITSASTYSQVQTAFNSAFLQIYPLFNPSSANWSSISVSPSPTTLIQAYNALIAKQVGNAAAIATFAPLPEFDNSANCLAGTSTDTLVETVDALTTYTCDLPTYDPADITTTCVTPGSSLTDTIQSLATNIDYLKTNSILTVNGTDMALADNGGDCTGVNLSIKSTSPVRRTVASNASDTAPGDLSAKLVAGDNITLDFSDNAHVVIAAETTTLDYKVKSTGDDTTADYLFNKVVGGSSSSGGIDTGIAIATTLLNPTDYETVSVYPVVNAYNFASFFMTTVSNDSELLIQFKNLMTQASAVSSANPPTDLVVTH